VTSAQQFSIDLTPAPGSLVVSVRGDLDAATAPRLRDALRDLRDNDPDRRVIVDVEGLTFIDSSGVYVLVQALKMLRSGGQRVTVSGASAGAHKVLDVCGLTSAFDLS
jgi:anti-sigma B factor antagonist